MKTDALKLIKRGKPYSVFRNTETGQYELWLIAGSKFVEQDDVFNNKTEALEAMQWAKDGFEYWINH